ncbi:fam-e protein [Plasmodium relictum]|uniref:Fam-e protein n=1 Tax=Plasmodium relictum TaxID=85471 RepID=A0A1J1GKU6_PLARL|nr:fam-e protein [Plasmodium relictum]CRG85129.1 fam-e protein [Plasmodium relictum]
MALLYNAGCSESEEDFTKCKVNTCLIRGGKFHTLHCVPAFEKVDVVDSSDDNSKDILKNIFKYKPSYTSKVKKSEVKSKVTILSKSKDDGILFLYDFYLPIKHYSGALSTTYHSKTFLCRIKTVNQKITLCEVVDPYHIGRTLSFHSFDISNKKREKSKIGLNNIQNPRHFDLRYKYKDTHISRDKCHYVTIENTSEQICRYSICTKDDNDHFSCADAKFNGKLFHLQDHSPLSEEHTKYIYIPKSCINDNFLNECTPYFCEIKSSDDMYQCEGLEMSAVKKIKSHSEGELMRLEKSVATPYKEYSLPSTYIAASFLPFLVLFFFVGCYLYAIFRRNRRKKTITKSKEP